MEQAGYAKVALLCTTEVLNILGNLSPRGLCSGQVVEPKVRAYLYTWGEGRMTAEGEFIPCRVESLDVGYIDGMMCVAVSSVMTSCVLRSSENMLMPCCCIHW